MKKIEKIMHFVILVAWIILLIVFILNGIQNYRLSSEQIKQLKQNQIEQAEEKEVYINRCKMYEELLEVNGLLDECECR